MYLQEYTGKGVRIAVIDSGVHAEHPHVRGVSGGVGIREDGALSDDFVDRLGHGTAVAAAIREKAPHADIVVIKVFWQMLATGIDTLIRGIDEAAARHAAVINLSLGSWPRSRSPRPRRTSRARSSGCTRRSRMRSCTVASGSVWCS